MVNSAKKLNTKQQNTEGCSPVICCSSAYHNPEHQATHRLAPMWSKSQGEKSQASISIHRTKHSPTKLGLLQDLVGTGPADVDNG